MTPHNVYAEQLTGELRGVYSAARELAAISGAFDPRQLLRDFGDITAIAPVLAALSADCRETFVSGELRWMLDAEVREVTLAGLIKDERLERIVAKAPLESGFDSFLRDILLGREINVGKLARGQLEDVYGALGAAGMHAGSAAPSQAEAVASVERSDAEAALDVALPTPLFGRDDNLADLAHFIATGNMAGPFGTIERVSEGRALTVCGIGGAGKSALLAAFCRGSRGHDWGGAPVVLLDFDNASLMSADHVDLTMELSRQLALHRPALAAANETMLKALGELGDLGDRSDYSRRASLVSAMWSHWQAAFAGPIEAISAIVILIDTFEEVMLRGTGEMASLLHWLRALRLEGGVAQLRVVVSGRSSPLDIEMTFDPDPSQRSSEEQRLIEEVREAVGGMIDIGDLDAPSAVNMLREHIGRKKADYDAYPLHGLIAGFGGHPLVVRLLGRFCQQNSVDAAHELLQDADVPGDVRREFAQTFLYRRIVGRIRDEDPAVHVLAYPGLVLRVVDAALIREVLAEPCGLGKIDNRRSDALFARLARQIWLVEPLASRKAVRHRRDLRRKMLPAVLAEKPNEARQIHAAAVRYYSETLAPSLASRIEGQYHQAFLTGADAIPPEEIAAFVNMIGPDIDDLPLAVRASLKYRADRALSREEADALGGVEQMGANRRDARNRLRHGYASAASGAAGVLSDLYSREGASPFAAGSTPNEGSRRDDADTLVEYLFTACEFDRLADQAPNLLTDFVAQISEPGWEYSALSEDLTSRPGWRAALAALATGRTAEAGQALEQAYNFFGIARQLEDDKGGRSRLRPVIEALRWLLASPTALPPQLPLASGERGLIVDQLLDLRYIAATGGRLLQEATRLRVRSDLIQPFAPGTFDAASGDPGDMHRAIRQAAWALDGTMHAWLQRITDVVALPPARRDLATLLTVCVGQEVGCTLTPAIAPIIGRLLLPGLMTDIHPALRTALVEIPPSVMVDAVASLWRAAQIWPVDLAPDRLGDGLAHDTHRWTATLIDVADRTGLLGKLLQEVRSIAASPALDMSYRLHTVYAARLRDNRLQAFT